MNFISLFSGIEAITMATLPLGWKCVAVCEIDLFPCRVLAKRHNCSAPKYLPEGFDRRKYDKLPPFGTPGTVPNFGDVSQVTDADVAALGHVDVVVGGSPCQDLSVAGKRAGFTEGSRSSLFHEQMRISNAARSLCGARWWWWENVPGAFSSNAGRDFAAVVGAMAGCGFDVPRDGWGTEGVALGPNGLVEWSVLDAQWFGVAQRRRRVFVVVDTGDWWRRPPVLLERESLRGDSAPRRSTGQKPAGTLARSSFSGGAGGRPEGAAVGHFVSEITGTLTVSGGHAVPGTCAQDSGAGFLIAMAHGQANAEIYVDGSAPTLTLLHEAPIVVGAVLIQDVAHTLRADGFDASEDGTGRGTPLVPVCAGTLGANHGNVKAEHAWTDQLVTAFTQNQRDEIREVEVPGALAAEPGMKQQTYIAFTTEQTPKFNEDCALTLTKQSPTGGGQPQAVAYAFEQRIARNGRGDHGEITGALTSQAGETGKGDSAPCVAIFTGDGETADPISANEAGTYTHEGTSLRMHNVVGPTPMAVRRLTPRECERLQGAPDDYTLLTDKTPDGPRYKALGNSMAIPCVAWIARQITDAQEIST